MASFKYAPSPFSKSLPSPCAAYLASSSLDRSGSGPLKTMALGPSPKRPAPMLQQSPSPAPKAPAAKQAPPSLPPPTISSPLKPAPATAPPPRSPAVVAPARVNMPLSPYAQAKPMPKMSGPPTSDAQAVPKMAPAPPAPAPAPPAPVKAAAQAKPAAPTAEGSQDSFPLDEEALLQAEAEADRKNAAAKSTATAFHAELATQSTQPMATPATQQAFVATPPTQLYTTQVAPASTAPPPAVASQPMQVIHTQPAAPPPNDEALRAEISALKYRLQVREQENERTKQELRTRLALCTEAEKKAQQLSAQLAFKNQELRDMDITLEQARAVVAPPAAAGGSAPAKEQMHTPEKATVSVAHPEEGSESQMEATDLEEAVEEGRDTLTAQRFKCAKATQHSPQKRKPKAPHPVLAVTPSSTEKKRRLDDPSAAAPGAQSEVDVLKKKLRACTGRLQSVKRALNGDFDSAEGGVAPMMGVEAVTAAAINTAAVAAAVATCQKEIAALREQLAARDQLIREHEEARKVEQQEHASAVSSLKRMEEVILKAEQAMKLMETERAKLLVVMQEMKTQTQKILEERVEVERALATAEKEVEALSSANKQLQASAQSAEERLVSARQEVERIKLQNEELGNECAAAKASRDVEARRAAKAEKEAEETRMRLLSMEQRAAEAAKQIHEDALRIAHMRRQHATELAEQRALFDEQLKKLAPLPSEEPKRDLLRSSTDGGGHSAPM